ncbi:hypothetical protein HDU83_001707 [Entophlyctis luteolus]|nr:hypothetical protein HDU83_001707 [Entophlyctis luteolus]
MARPLASATWLAQALSRRPPISPHAHAPADASSSRVRLLDASFLVPLRMRLPAAHAIDSLSASFKRVFSVPLSAADNAPASALADSPEDIEYFDSSDDEICMRDVGLDYAQANSLQYFHSQAIERFSRARIREAQFFNLATISDSLRSFPLLAPSSEDFAYAMDKLDITNDDHVVVYDSLGIRSSPRAWWLFKLMGHDKVSVLNGGLPEWIKLGLPVDTEPAAESVAAARETSYQFSEQPKYMARMRNEMLIEFHPFLAIVSDLMDAKRPVILDVRAPERYYGVGPEPLVTSKKLGTIPTAINIHWREFLDEQTGLMKHPMDIIRVFKENGRRVDLDKDIIVFGSKFLTSRERKQDDGISASVACLSLEMLGKTTGVTMYDAGWAEWSSQYESIVMRKRPPSS